MSSCALPSSVFPYPSSSDRSCGSGAHRPATLLGLSFLLLLFRLNFLPLSPPTSLLTPLLLSSASFEPSPFVLFPCTVQALLLPLFFPQSCLHEGFESSFIVRSHESCANCTSASVGRDTHLWSPMLCKSASRPSKPLDAASRCDPPLHSVMCQDGFPTMHSLVRCQGKKKNKEQIICCRHRQTHYLQGRERSRSAFTESNSLPNVAFGRVCIN